jgi:hypothetical protein
VTAVIAQIRAPIPADDVVSGLRGLDDRIESGEVEYPVSTCLVLIGHTSDRNHDGEVWHRSDHDMFGYGPRCDTFTVRGLLATALRD